MATSERTRKNILPTRDGDGGRIDYPGRVPFSIKSLPVYLNDVVMAESITYDAANRVTGVTGRSTLGYTVDAAGNLTQSH